MPYESVFREAAANKEFWETELRGPAIYERLEGNASAHAGHAEVMFPAMAAENSAKRAPPPPALTDAGGDDPGRPAKKPKDEKPGTCRAFNEGGCVQRGRCPKGYAHRCDVCKQGGHNALACPRKGGAKEGNNKQGKGDTGGGHGNSNKCTSEGRGGIGGD